MAVLLAAIAPLAAAPAAAHPLTVGEAISGKRLPDPPRFPVRGGGSFGEAEARFGAGRSGHEHEGQDVFAPAGTPLLAVRDAVVLETGDGGGRGNYVALYSRAKRQTYVYMHMQEPSPLKRGRRVDAGKPVGKLGCTGSCFGDHLHFEVRLGRGAQAAPVDPLPLLERLERSR